MTREEIIDGLLDNAKDRRSLVPPDEQDSISEHDAQVMEEAAELIMQQHRELMGLRMSASRKRRFFNFGYQGKRLKA